MVLKPRSLSQVTPADDPVVYAIYKEVLEESRNGAHRGIFNEGTLGLGEGQVAGASHSTSTVDRGLTCLCREWRRQMGKDLGLAMGTGPI